MTRILCILQCLKSKIFENLLLYFQIQSILTSVKKFQDWKKVCEILMEKLFGNEVLARSNVSGTQGRMKLNDEKLEVLKGMIYVECLERSGGSILSSFFF
jgi:hypothetical protein